MASSEIASHVSGLCSGSTGDQTSKQVDTFSTGGRDNASCSIGDLWVVAVSGATDDNLGSLCASGDRVNIGVASALDSDEGEQKAKDD